MYAEQLEHVMDVGAMHKKACFWFLVSILGIAGMIYLIKHINKQREIIENENKIIDDLDAKVHKFYDESASNI
jgi:hypothetical protein